MKIVIPIFHFVKSGGMRVICMLANEWAKKGNYVELVVADNSRPYFYISDSVKITYLNKKNWVQKLISVVKYIKSLKNVDCVIANQNLTASYAWIVSICNNIRGFYYIQAYEPDFYSFKNVKLIIKKIIAIISYFLPLIKIVNSDIYMNYKLIKTDKVVYPGLDLELYYPKDISCFNDIIKIGTIGRTEEWKGTADVCKAMEMLQAEGVKFQFYIAFNDFNTVTHYYVRPDGDTNLAAFYREMDIVVAACKGQHGAIHYPVIESMATGTSIVCTDFYPSNNDNAYLIEASAPKQIAEAVKKIINNKEDAIRKREQALKDVQQFSWPIVAEKFLDYLKGEIEINDNAK